MASSFHKASREIFAAGKEAQVPLLAGWNRDEGSSIALAGEKTTPISLKNYAKQFPDKQQEFLALYGDNGNPAVQKRGALDFAGDDFIAYSTWKWLEVATKTDYAPVYRYMFEEGSPADAFHPAGLAFHSSELSLCLAPY